jgi:16S rRNA processing protein RimM
MTNTASPRVLMGKIVAAHGLRGEVKVLSYSADPAALFVYPLKRSDGAPAPKLTLVRPDKNALIVRVDGVVERNGAEALRGVELYVDAADLPAAAADEIYHAALIGLEARDPSGVVLGRVGAIENFGASDLLDIIDRPDGAPSVYIPFVETYVPEITDSYVVIDAPDGFWS